ncbi:hypothetical protein [Kribbella monticola]|uniref:hypothetical protein n=1 Tax=Kribbella monticola TaxID=2185285 RepID=UPI000DD3F883|nr:hypothetical protein [Kribbella monticola]
MTGIGKRLATTALAASLVLAGTAELGVTTASAATACRTNTKSVSLPGKPDVTFKVQLCVSGSGTLRHAQATFSWSGNYGYIGGTRFNVVYLTVLLEQHDGGRGATGSYYTANVDDQYSGTVSLGVSKTGSLSSGGWSADGDLQYDVTDDGNPTHTWELYGSPEIS